MKKKIIRIVSIALIAIGILLSIGTVGASELDLISFKSLVLKQIIAISLMVGGVAIGRIGGGSYV